MRARCACAPSPGASPRRRIAGAAAACAFAAAATLPPDLPEGWTLRLTPDHRLTVEAEAPLRATAVELVGEMVRFALALDPWLDRLEAAGAA